MSAMSPFVFDDELAIAQNPAIRQLRPLTPFLANRDQMPTSGRPLAAYSLALNYAWGGLEPFGYHLTNVILHLAAGLALFAWLSRLWTTWGPMAPARAGAMAWGVAALWLVHPLQTEVVHYVVQRTEILMGLCLLLTLYCSTRALAAPAGGGWWRAGAIAACGLGMLSKESMVVAPLLVALYDRTVVSGSFARAWRQHAPLHVGLALTWLPLAALVALNPHSWSVGSHLLNPWRYALTQSGVIAHYLRLAVWPHPLCIDYGDWPIARSFGDVAPSAALLAAGLALTGLGVAQRRMAGFWAAWVVLLLAPTSSVLPIATEVAAERRMYLPLVGLLVLVVRGLWRAAALLGPQPRRQWRVAMACTVVLLGPLTMGTLQRGRLYTDTVALWQDAVRTRPGNARAHNNLGVALQRAGALDEAAHHFRETLRLGADAQAANNLGVVLMQQGDLEQAQRLFRRALQAHPDSASAHYNLGCALAKQGRFVEAIAAYRAALALQPDDVEARFNLGNALADAGLAADARQAYEETLRRGERAPAGDRQDAR